MSAKYLPRELGVVLCCNGCGKKLQTGQIQFRLVRAYAKTIGWGRGLRKSKRRDLCDACMPTERAAFAELKSKRERRRLERDEKRRLAKEKKAAARAEPNLDVWKFNPETDIA